MLILRKTEFIELWHAMTSPLDEAWNNFVLNSEPTAYAKGSVKWAAATANKSMNLVYSGGFCSFLTITYDVDPRDAVLALSIIGANHAAKNLERILQDLGTPLPPSSEEERWNLLERYWTEDLDQFDNLSEEADAELKEVFAAHVLAEENFYLGLTALKARQAKHWQ